MKLLTATCVAITGLGLCAVPRALAADDSFVGKWKLNPEKSQFNGLTYKIDDAGGNKYRFTFGDDVETVPLDGKDHMTKYGNTWAIKNTGPNTWKSTQKRDGKVTSTSIWTVSEDGQTFTSTDENKRPDGSTSHNEAKFKRTAGTSGLVGTWESTELKLSSPAPIEVEMWKGDGYVIVNPSYKGRTEFKLDGKDYADKGPRVAKGSTVSAKRVDDRTIELTDKLKGKTTATERYEVSADGKTLTDTISYAGLDKPEVDVYDRQ
jgi:hypothetical protein